MTPEVVSPPQLSTQAWFQVRAMGLRVLRFARDQFSEPARGTVGDPAQQFTFRIAVHESHLGSPGSASEDVWRRGKTINIKRASIAISDRVFEAGTVFSFWSLVGPPWASRGFAVGREIRSGCVIPTTGGGLCQLASALYEAAVRAGCEITEHHRHSRAIESGHAGSAVIFWNYIDLRFRLARRTKIVCEVDHDILRVEFLSEVEEPAKYFIEHRSLPIAAVKKTNDCLGCARVDCNSRSKYLDRLSSLGELTITEEDSSLTSWQRLLLKVSWRTTHRRTSLAERSVLKARWTAAAVAKRVRFHHGPLKIPQRLLPHLWIDGALTDKQFSVELKYLPLREMHARLDRLVDQQPGRERLKEYRAPKSLIEAEESALSHARRLTTHHPELATLMNAELSFRPVSYRERIHAPEARAILLPAPATWREGADQVAEIARRLKLRVLYLGSLVEREIFRDIEASSIKREHVDWSKILAVVHPAIFTASREIYDEAAAHGVPLLVSRGSGLSPTRGCHVYPEDTQIEKWIETLTTLTERS